MLGFVHLFVGPSTRQCHALNGWRVDDPPYEADLRTFGFLVRFDLGA